jgi:hypothetical protein
MIDKTPLKIIQHSAVETKEMETDDVIEDFVVLVDPEQV